MVSAVIFVVTMVFGCLAVLNDRAVREEIGGRVPPRFQSPSTSFLSFGLSELRSGWTEFVWLPGVPLWIRHKHVSSRFYFAICTAGIALLAAVSDVLPLTLLFGGFLAFLLVTTLVTVIRHRDQLR